MKNELDARKRGGRRAGSGRKVQIENGSVHSIKIADEVWNAIPEPRPEFIRQSIKDGLKRIIEK
jgi:hypothetical protein